MVSAPRGRVPIGIAKNLRIGTTTVQQGAQMSDEEESLSNGATAPRAIGGGRSARYERRRVAGKRQKQYAPEWSDAGSRVVLEALHAGASLRKVGITSETMQVLTGRDEREKFERSLKKRLSPTDQALVSAILKVHVKRLAHGSKDAMIKKSRAFLKPLRARAASRMVVRALEVTAAKSRVSSFTAWLARDPRKERLRDIRSNERILAGLARWPLQ